MNRLAYLVFLASFISLSNPVVAQAKCPDWIKNKMRSFPACPEGGAIPETYPVAAVVASDLGMQGKDSSFTVDFVTKVLQSAGKDTPIIALPVSDETYELVLKQIDNVAKTEKEKKRFREAIVQVPADSWTWQQDYFQSFVNPNTGLPVIRKIEKYNRAGDSADFLGDTLKECGLLQGPDLKTPQFVSGMSGGNVQTLPFGICALGDDHFKDEKDWLDYANQFCGKNPANRLKTPTSWLSVGHTDEIVKTIRNKTVKSEGGLCDFSIVVASPKKAIELLSKKPNEAFLGFSSRLGAPKEVLSQNRIYEYQILSQLCDDIDDFKNNGIRKNPSSSTQKSVSYLEETFSSVISKAWANVYLGVSDSVKDCSKITNGQVVEFLNNKKGDWAIYNDLVQKEMDKLKVEIEDKLKAKHSRCKVDIIDAPDLFYGGSPVLTKDGYELPKRMGLSVLPNPTNSVSMNDTIISPDLSNDAFKEYMSEQYKLRGLDTKFVDTFDYAHIGQGNLHCSTHTLHICKPRIIRESK